MRIVQQRPKSSKHHQKSLHIMWLIDTKTLRVKEFPSDRRPKYAILSHKWEKDELSFQQFQNQNACHKMKGYQKVIRFCREAHRNGLNWGWVDTCCIDKRNPTELSEAINSMFMWYRDSAACYVYLHEFSKDALQSQRRTRTKLREHLRLCEWFERGWTLQELIAPSTVIFFDRSWRHFGDKRALADEISYITRVSASLLKGTKSLEKYSCAQKMSWAALRKTKRPEDRAYSLFGLFGITMPTLYGEGHEAFRRLQEAILVRSPDHTLFAWTLQGPEEFPTPTALRTLNPYSILAPSPDCFLSSSSVVPFEMLQSDQLDQGSELSHQFNLAHYRPTGLRRSGRSPYSIINGGLRIQLARRYIGDKGRYSMFEAMLDCYDASDAKGHVCTICVVRTMDNFYVQRAEPYFLGKVTWAEYRETSEFFLKDFLFRPVWIQPEDMKSTDSGEMAKQVQMWKARAASRIERLYAETTELDIKDGRVEQWHKLEQERVQDEPEEERLEEHTTLRRIASTESLRREENAKKKRIRRAVQASIVGLSVASLLSISTSGHRKVRSRFE